MTLLNGPMILGLILGLYIFSESRRLVSPKHLALASLVPFVLPTVHAYLSGFVRIAFWFSAGPLTINVIAWATPLVGFVVGRRLVAKHAGSYEPVSG